MVRHLAAAGVSANAVTLAALLLALGWGLWAALSTASAVPWLLLPAVLLLRMALNAIDGMLAREHGQATPLGAVLNEFCDLLSDLALYLPFALLDLVHTGLLLGLALVALLGEFAGVLIQALGGQRRYDGPMGKSDRALVFGLLALAVGLGMARAPWVDVVLALCLLLGLLGLVNRLGRGLAELGPR